MKVGLDMENPISLSYPILRIKSINHLPIRKRSREGERAFIEFVTLFASPSGDSGHEKGVDK